MQDANMGKKIHDDIVSQGLLKRFIVLGNAVVDMYAKCGVLQKAQKVLEELQFGMAGILFLLERTDCRICPTGEL